MDNIFAQCSAYGKAGVSIFRISGTNALEILNRMLRGKRLLEEPRKLYLCDIYDPRSGQHIDQVMAVYFTEGASFTGEETVEIYTHGSIAVSKILTEGLSSLSGVRMAEPGEFSKRSFLNGKMDLVGAEGLADLIDAETEMQHFQAMRQFRGDLGMIYDNWHRLLVRIMGLAEGYIDFPDEDIPDIVIKDARTLVQTLISEIELHLDDNHRGERLRNGIKLAILGRPNVGKSSLINYLARRDIAITSEIAGTTRDVIESYIDLGGYPIILQDTAGIHSKPSDKIEAEGIKRAKAIFQDADIKIIMYDISSKDADNSSQDKDNASQDEGNSSQEDYFSDLIDKNSIILLNKVDLHCRGKEEELYESNKHSEAGAILAISIKNGHNLSQLLDKIILMSEEIATPSQTPQITRSRHRDQLKQALSFLSRCSDQEDLILFAEDIRMSMRSLHSITGKITVDEILGEIFSNFCIGK